MRGKITEPKPCLNKVTKVSRSSITLLSIFLLIACGFRKLAGHGVECQAMAAEY